MTTTLNRWEKVVLLEAVETFMELRKEDGGYIYNRSTLKKAARKLRDELEGDAIKAYSDPEIGDVLLAEAAAAKAKGEAR